MYYEQTITTITHTIFNKLIELGAKQLQFTIWWADRARKAIIKLIEQKT